MTALNRSTLAAFNTWLSSKRPLGAAVSEWQFAVADATGANWVTRLDDLATVRSALAGLRDSGRKVWAPAAGRAAIALSPITGEPLRRLGWLLDASTAYRVTHPGTSHWLAQMWGSVYKDAPRGAARTAVATARVMAGLGEGLAAETRAAVFVAAEQEQIWRPAQARGWRLDEKLLGEQLTRMNGERAQWKRELGIDLLNTDTDAGTAAAHRWLARFGIAMVDADGNPSLSRDDARRATVPATIEAKDAWMAFRAVRTLASHLAKLHELRAASVGGRVFSMVTPYAQKTGRMSVTRPALQNITGDSRPLLLADPGMALVSLDYRQVEPRVAAALSGDQHLAADLASNVDIYTALARRAGATDVDRPLYKTGFLATLYGQGAPSLAKVLDTAEDAARELIDSIWSAYPDLARFAAEMKESERTGDRDLLNSGRLQAVARGPYAALNARIQATAADIFYAGCARVAAVLGAEALWLGVHDEVVVQVPEADTELAVAVLERQMATAIGGVQISGEAEVVGRAWRK